jgi:SAM-dependent methyltransferase
MKLTPKRIIFAILRRTLSENQIKRLYAAYCRYFKSDRGYSKEYFTAIDHDHTEAYLLLAETIISVFSPKTITDVGCGSGGLSLALIKRGVSVQSFDFSEASLALARSKGVTQAQQLDLITARTIGTSSDVCVCLEVAEHLPASSAGHLTKLLSEVAPTLVFTAAPPGQGGHFHINEQPQKYWIDLFKSAGMSFDQDAVTEFRLHYNGKMLNDYDQNLMIFRKTAS